MPTGVPTHTHDTHDAHGIRSPTRGNTTDYDYDASTNLLRQLTTPEEKDIRYDYNPYTDQLRRVFLDLDRDNTYDSNETYNYYTYDDDRLSRITSNGLSYYFDYDNFGYNTAVKVGNSSTQATLITNTYDTNTGLLSESDYGNGDEVSYVYDDLNRPIKVYYDGVLKFRYYYNGEGTLGRMVDIENDIDYYYMYDAAGRPGMVSRDNGIISWYQYDDNLNNHLTNEYFYEQIGDTGTIFKSTYRSDEDGRPVYAILEKDDETNYCYEITIRDQLSRTQEAEYKLGSSNTKFTYYYDYESGGNGTDTNLIEEVRYDGTSDVVNYTYDDNGNIATISDGTNTIQYYYDALNQLVRENNPFLGTSGQTVIYAYNRGGNMENKRIYAFTAGTATPTTQLDVIDYSYGSAFWGDKLTSYDGNSISHDNVGNVVSHNGWAYTWKWGKRLATAGNTSAGISTSYKYDDKGIRTYKRVTDGGSTTTYNYNLMGDKITYEERTGSGACSMYYAYDNSSKLFGVYYDGAGTSNDGFYFFKRNIQGDIIGILDRNGVEVVTYLYDTWGKLISTTGSKASTIGEDNPFRYRGYYYDEETGLYYLNQRYYNPEWGRFISADTVIGQQGDLLGHNLFAYCQNNPVTFCDPSGNFLVAAIVVGALIGATVLLSGCSNSVSNKPDLDRSSASPGTYNCYGNAIGKQVRANPTGYVQGQSTEDTFKQVVKDIGADNIRRLQSIDDPISEEENMVAMKCGPDDYHFMVRVGGVWYNKPGTTRLIENELSSIVTADIWYGRYLNSNGVLHEERSIYYDDETIYFAISKEW